MVTSWLVAVPDLVTGDLHGLSLTLGIVFILAAPVTVTAIALLEMRRLKRRYGIRLNAHPATHPPVPGRRSRRCPRRRDRRTSRRRGTRTVIRTPPSPAEWAAPYAPHPQPPYDPQCPYGG